MIIPMFASAFNVDDNLARGKNTYQSSTLSEKTIAENAVDGNRDPEYRHGSCIHTTISETRPFWVVDLGQIYRISYVAITNRNGKT